MQSVPCPFCRQPAPHFFQRADIDYFDCAACDFIFVHPELLTRIDAGEPIRIYDDSYWHMELPAAKERSWGASILRVAETMLYARLPITRFLDVGTGPGWLLDALTKYLPDSTDMFWGIETFPPPPEFRSSHPQYCTGDYATLPRPFQAGLCMETIEHLTPAMLDDLVSRLVPLCEPKTLLLFNTALTDYIRTSDCVYLEPRLRGHIVSWSVAAVTPIFRRHGFCVHPLPGKTWAFLAEYQGALGENVRDRIWTPHPLNKARLHDSRMGTVLYLAGIDTARAY
jgi:hypothetical protein